jgi:hypothetical protein
VEGGVVKLQKSSSVKLKPKYSRNERVELTKKIMKLPSRAIENILNIAFGKIEENETIFYLNL